MKEPKLMETKGMKLQCTRKYVRVKNSDMKPVAKTKLLPTLSRSIEQDDETLPRTYLQSSNADGEIILEEVQYDDAEDSAFVKYTVNLDDLNGNFSSTTIVNGSTVSLSELQFAGGASNDSVLVMPFDNLDVPMVTTDSDDNEIKTLQVDNFSPITDESTSVGGTYIATSYSDGEYIIMKQDPVPVQQPNLPAPRKVKAGKTETKLYYPDKPNSLSHGGRRGLIRLGRSRMIADTHTTIPVSEFKHQLNYTCDIIGQLDLAPSTKAAMYFLNTKGVNKLFANPGRPMGAKLRRSFVRHLSIKQTPVEVTYNDMPLLPIGFMPPVDPKSIKRITRKRRYPEAEEYQRKMLDLKVEFMEDMEPEEVIIPDCKDSIVLLSNQQVMDDEGNIYNDEFSPSIGTIEEEQELDSFPFGDSLESSTELTESQELDTADEYVTGDDYSNENQFHNNKATIIMIEDENGVQENVAVMLTDECNGGEESQVIFYHQPAEDMKDIMIVPDEPSFTETVITS